MDLHSCETSLVVGVLLLQLQAHEATEGHHTHACTDSYEMCYCIGCPEISRIQQHDSTNNCANLLQFPVLTNFRSRLIFSGFEDDMLAGVDTKYSSSMASTLHVLVGEAAGASLTATGEEGPRLALAEMCVWTALNALCLV